MNFIYLESSPLLLQRDRIDWQGTRGAPASARLAQRCPYAAHRHVGGCCEPGPVVERAWSRESGYGQNDNTEEVTLQTGITLQGQCPFSKWRGQARASGDCADCRDWATSRDASASVSSQAGPISDNARGETHADLQAAGDCNRQGTELAHSESREYRSHRLCRARRARRGSQNLEAGRPHLRQSAPHPAPWKDNDHPCRGAQPHSGWSRQCRAVGQRWKRQLCVDSRP